MDKETEYQTEMCIIDGRTYQKIISPMGVVFYREVE